MRYQKSLKRAKTTAYYKIDISTILKITCIFKLIDSVAQIKIFFIFLALLMSQMCIDRNLSAVHHKLYTFLARLFEE